MILIFVMKIKGPNWLEIEKYFITSFLTYNFYIFRDFMSDIETNAFKEAANGKLHRSGHSTKQIGGDIDISGATTFKRTSKQIWLSDVHTTTTDTNSDKKKGFPSHNEEAFRVGLQNKLLTY